MAFLRFIYAVIKISDILLDSLLFIRVKVFRYFLICICSSLCISEVAFRHTLLIILHFSTLLPQFITWNMCTNTVFSAAHRAVPGLTTPVSCPTTRHVSVSQGPSSGVHVVTRKLFHCCHSDHALRTKVSLLLCSKFKQF
jgi:hypothetical protein